MATLVLTTPNNIDDDGSGVAWSSNSVTPAGGTSSYKRFRDFTFGSTIDASTRIDGFELLVKTYTNGGSTSNETWRIYKADGSAHTLDTDVTEVGNSGTVGSKTVGSPSSLASTTWSASDINSDADFGYGLSVTGPTGGQFVNYDSAYTQITIYYTTLTSSAKHATAATSSGTGGAWSNPTNAFSSDNSYATNTSFGTSQYLILTDFDFVIPGGATIVGIKAQIEHKADDADTVSDSEVYLTKNGTSVVGDNKASATFWGISDETFSYGSTVDLWGTTWTDSEINSVNFGIMIRTSTDSNQAYVDDVILTVYYIEAGSSSCKMECMGIIRSW